VSAAEHDPVNPSITLYETVTANSANGTKKYHHLILDLERMYRNIILFSPPLFAFFLDSLFAKN
jgi:hypothetical protein